MLRASWRRALRASCAEGGRLCVAEAGSCVVTLGIGGLPVCAIGFQLPGASFQFGSCGLEGFGYAGCCGAADDVVAVEGGLEGDGAEEVFGEMLAEFLEVGERECV